MSKHSRRVVITGLGVMCPAGNSLDSYWQKVTSGHSALRHITSFDVGGYPAVIAGEVDNSLFEPSEIPGPLESIDRGLLLGRAALRRALADSGLSLSSDARNRVGLVIGSGAGPSQSLEEAYLKFAAHGYRGLRPRTVPSTMFNSISAHLGIEFHLHGPQVTMAAACASANMAMSRAVDLIRTGRVTQVFTGGVEMPLCRSVYGSWAALRVLSTVADPNAACLPFDRRRRGLCLAEGAAFFLFEDLQSAEERKAKIYAEVAGYGENNDGSHITQPSAASQAEAIRFALEDAGLSPGDVHYINAHGTATELNDMTETEAIKLALGEHARQVSVSSTKSVIGHALGASGALELVASLGAIAHQVVPPTANLKESDPRCDLDYVPCEARRRPVKAALSNSFAFGGANSVLVLREFQKES